MQNHAYKKLQLRLKLIIIVPLWAKNGHRSDSTAFNSPRGAYPQTSLAHASCVTLVGLENTTWLQQCQFVFVVSNKKVASEAILQHLIHKHFPWGAHPLTPASMYMLTHTYMCRQAPVSHGHTLFCNREGWPRETTFAPPNMKYLPPLNEYPSLIDNKVE